MAVNMSMMDFYTMASMIGVDKCSNAVCDMPAMDLTCAGCRKRVYCGKDCQREHWNQPLNGHKAECKIYSLVDKVAGSGMHVTRSVY